MSVGAVGVVNNKVNFGSKHGHKKEEIRYKRTDAFKIGGAIAGAGISAGTLLSFNKFKNTGYTGGQIAVWSGICAAIGLALGTLIDAGINKTVKNTVASVKQNEELGCC